jgi:hypothetical protein
MKFFFKRKDGGAESHVTGFWLIEWKRGFSVVFLHFAEGSRDAYHSHAFNAITWFFWGRVMEHFVDGSLRLWRPSIFPKWTPRSSIHRVVGMKKSTYALSFRGPWTATWKEYVHGNVRTFRSGRKLVEVSL